MAEDKRPKEAEEVGGEELARAVFPGEIVVVDTEDGLERAVEEMRGHRILGFDTESRPSFKKHEHHNVALIQLSSRDKCWLVRTNILGFGQGIREVLEDGGIYKVGASLRDDTGRLRKLSPFTPKGLIDLQPIAKAVGIQEQSVRKLAAKLLGLRVSKRAQLSNWESETLSEGQQQYAATDAWICLRMLYVEEFRQYLRGHHYDLPPYEEV